MCFIPYITDLLNCADKALLLFINGLHTPALDVVMWVLSDRWVWIPLYMLLAWLLIRRVGPVAGITALVLVAGLILATDQTCATLIRPAIARLRPTNPDNPLSAAMTIVNDYRGGSYSFPSCHAANTMALAVFLSLVYRHRFMTLSIIAWSIIVSYSRIYLGVHYPSDIFAGFLVGSFFAFVFYYIYRYVCSRSYIRRRAPLVGRRSPRGLFSVVGQDENNGGCA